MKISHFQWVPSRLIILTLILIWNRVHQVNCTTKIHSFRPDATADNIKWENGYFLLPLNQQVVLTLEGNNFNNETIIVLTTSNSTCRFDAYPVYSFSVMHVHSKDNNTALLTIEISDDRFFDDEKTAYFCLDFKLKTISGDNAVHQGSSPRLTLKFYSIHYDTVFLPKPVAYLFIICLVFLSACFSGLNLGLMSLNITELKIILKCGSKWDRRFARVIYPIRKHGNYLLCTLLLGNVLVNSTLTILLADVSGTGAAAVALSTIIIVIFGEIIPQAICNRYGLAIGAVTLPLTLLAMILTFPLSFPISKILDCILGEELGTRYRKDELLELVNQDKENLEPDEKNIIAGTNNTNNTRESR